MPTRIIVPGLILMMLMLTISTQSGAEQAGKHAATKADAMRGKELFNGKGICHYCHGLDGVIGNKPPLTPDTQAVLARIAPSPPDLSKPSSLRLNEDEARFHAVRDGHPGTGMFPDTTLSDQDIRDLLAYLALLREGSTDQR